MLRFSSGPKIGGFIVCDDEFILYGDGKFIGGDKNWAKAKVGKKIFDAKPRIPSIASVL